VRATVLGGCDYLVAMTIRWGIASTGTIAASMTDALLTLPDAEVVAVGSRTQAAADEFAARFGIATAHGAYADLYDDADVDIVYVASPHSHHHEMTIAALRAGKHVLCEKAFAINASQAREMVDVARTKQRFLMEAMWTWFIPAVVDVKRRIDDGEIGDVVVIESDFGIPVPDTDGRHRRADLAGGALLDLGIYPISFARFLAGDPVDVRALARLDPSGVDSTLGGVLTLSSGAISVFHTSLDAMSTLRATIIGTRGRIEVDAPFWFTSGFTVRADGRPPEHVAIANQGLAHEAAHAMERIRDGHLDSDVIPLATTISTMEILDEIRSQVGVVYPGELLRGA
jgi:predicted dehydrogenase